MKGKSTCGYLEGDGLRITDENFIYELKRRNERALDYVIDHYGGLIKFIVNKNMTNLDGYKDECINDCLLGIWNNIGSFDESRSSFKNWVGGIAKYKSIDYLRKYKFEFETSSIDDMEIEVSDKTPNEIIEKEQVEIIENLLEELSEKDRLLFKKLLVEEEHIDRVSEDLNLNKSNIYNRISRGRKKLKKFLKEEDYVK